MNSTQVNEIGAITPDLSIIDGQITATSNQVAAHFGKAHRSVLLAIRRLECSEEFRLHNFVQSSYMNEQGKKQPCYRLTRDGFVFLAMGFTGKEAAQWKEAYITAFNKMEQALLAKTMRAANPAIDYDRISPAQAQDLKELVQSIVDAGIQGFGETWARLHRKFRVNSYLELPAARFAEARDYLLGKLPKQPAAIPDAERLSLAFSVATEAGAQVQRSVFTQLCQGLSPETVHARTIAAVAFDRSGKPVVPWAATMGPQEFVASADSLPKIITNRDVLLSDAQASHIISACAQLLSERAASRIAA